MATIINLLKRNRWIEARGYGPSETRLNEAEMEASSGFLSERGMILIGCVLYCAFVWGALFRWLFG